MVGLNITFLPFIILCILVRFDMQIFGGITGICGNY